MRGVTIVAAAGMATLAAALPASGGTAGPTVDLGNAKGLKYLKAPFEEVVTQAGPAVACPGDREATGGGGAISGATHNALLNSSYPTSAPEGWHSEGSRQGGPARTVTTWAICGKVDMLQSQSTTTLTPGQEFSSGFACSEGLDATSGGVEGDGGLVRITGMNPRQEPPFDWVNSFRNVGTTNSVVRDYMRCTAEYELTYRSASTRVEPGQAGVVKATCARSQAVAGGGLRPTKAGNFTNGMPAIASRPIDSKDSGTVPDDGWLAKAHNFLETRATLTVHAVCKA
jgi:hypothetical protein